MKHSTKRLAAVLAALLTLSLTACGGTPADSGNGAADTPQAAVKLTPYDAPGGTFSVSMPEIEGGWTTTDGGNDYHLVLDNSDQSFTVLIQGLPMEQAQSSITDLDGLITVYRQTTLAGFGEPTAAEVTVGDPAIEGVKADTYTVEQGGHTAKALVCYFQTENAYYVCILTGTGEAYDQNIDAVQAALTTFTEKA